MKHFSVKICGITRVQDAQYATKLGADMVGLIFHPASLRYLTLPKAKRITAVLPPTIDRVGVFVNHTITQILKISDSLVLQYVQVHRMLNASEVKQLQDNHLKVIQSIFVSTTKEVANLRHIKADIILLDNQTATTPGGTGEPFDWSLSIPKSISNLMLAGGINIRNVAEGVRKFSPLIVDVNCGVESSAGIKSKLKLRAFMQECNRLRYGK